LFKNSTARKNMGVKIKSNFTVNDIRKMTDGFYDRIVNAVVQAFGLLGMKCVNYARAIPQEVGYTDRTGNLRSSTGFKVFHNGVAVREDYKQVLDGSEGLAKGKALADEAGARCGDNQVMLVVTAGMEYAVCVESLGRDVLTSTEQLAERSWPEMKQRIDDMVKRQMGG